MTDAPANTMMHSIEIASLTFMAAIVAGRLRKAKALCRHRLWAILWSIFCQPFLERLRL